MFLKNSFFEYSDDNTAKMVADSLNVLSQSVAGKPVNRDRRKDSSLIITSVQKEMQAQTAYMQAAAHIIHMTSENRKEAAEKVSAQNLLPKIGLTKKLKS
jgi:hypothetical protein